MPFVFEYLLKLSVSLAIVFLFYQLVLRRLTFYGSNRWFLAGYSLLSFFIPLIDVGAALARHRWNDAVVVQLIPVIGSALPNNRRPVAGVETSSTAWSAGSMLFVFFLAIAGLLFLRLIVRYLSFRRLRRRAVLLSDGDIRVYRVSGPVAPFSFGRSVFVNPDLHEEKELEDIIRHEFVHVKQRHTMDILWAEWLCIINWYNPFAWLLRRSIRQNLEFIADRQVLNGGLDRKQYQYLLLKVIGNNQFSIAHNFNFSSLKKRIAMMNKLKSAKAHLFKFLFVLPLLAVLLLAFRSRYPLSAVTPRTSPVAAALPAPVIEAVATDTAPVLVTEKGYSIERPDGEAGDIVIKNKNGKQVKKITVTEWKKNSGRYQRLYGSLAPEALEQPEALEAPEPPARAETREAPEAKEQNEATGIVSGSNRPVKVTGVVAVASGVNVSTNVTGTGSVASVARTSSETISGSGASVRSVSTSSSNSIDGVGTTITSGYTGANAPVANGEEISGEMQVLLSITPSTTAAQLEGIKTQLKEKGLELVYTNTQYDERGKLRAIQGTMTSKSSHCTFSASDFQRVLVIEVKSKDGVYFRVEVKDTTKTVI